MKRNYGFNVRSDDDTVRVLFCKKGKLGVNWIGFIQYYKKDDGSTFGGGIKLWEGDMQGLKSMNYIMKDIDNNCRWKDNIENLLEYVVNEFERYVYDPREYDIISIKDVKPKEYKRYMGWYNGKCLHSIITDEDWETTKKLLIEKAEGVIEKRSGYLAEKYKNWLKESEVKLDTMHGYPEIEDIDKYIKKVK